MFSHEIYGKFKNTCFEGQICTTASSSSSFKLDLADLPVFSDLNLRPAKVKSFRSVFISSKFSRFCSHVIEFENDVTLFFCSFLKNWRQK